MHAALSEDPILASTLLNILAKSWIDLEYDRDSRHKCRAPFMFILFYFSNINMKKYVYLTTWGCQMNEYDSSRLLDLLQISQNFFLTQDPSEADLLILNTCSIREKAQEKLFHQLGRWAHYKKNASRRPFPLIAVGGCVASQEQAALLKRAPYIDIIFGPQTLQRLPEMIGRRLSLPQEGTIIDAASEDVEEKFDQLPFQKQSALVSSVTIMEGCDKFCSYCIVPYTRGPEVCRSLGQIRNEVLHCLKQGAREIVLLGQNVNAWREHRPEGPSHRFSDLLRNLCALPDLKRLRFITSHPLEMSEDVCEVFAQEPKIASLLHLPIQSGSDRILAEMARGHSAEDYLSIIKKLKTARPDLLISSDFIVGFPGETEQDFKATLAICEKVKFDISYSFIYSVRPKTPAAMMPDETPLALKKERLNILQKCLAKNVLANTRQFLGRREKVLVEVLSPTDPKKYRGRTSQGRWVTFLSEANCIGALVSVKITEIQGTGLIGELE